MKNLEAYKKQVMDIKKIGDFEELHDAGLFFNDMIDAFCNNVTVENFIKNRFDIDAFISDLQKLDDIKDVFGEIATSNLTNDEILYCVHVIAFNDTFKFTKK